MSLRAAAVLAVLVTSFAAPTHAAEEAQVVRLKDNATLRGKSGDTLVVKRDAFAGPWPVRQANPDGSYVVEVEGKPWTVDPWLVEVKGRSQLVVQPQPGCMDNRDQRLAGTRNVGDCVKK